MSNTLITADERQRLLDLLHQSFEILQHLVPVPTRVERMGGTTFRYSQRTPEQAALQKLARVLSGLTAMELLSLHGFFQEQAALQRVHDELTEDITFIALAIAFDQPCATLTQLLDAFYTETMSGRSNHTETPKGPKSPPRKKVRARILALESGTENPSCSVDAAALVSRTYSAFVHASSEAIMDMYDGASGRFLTRGMQASELAESHRADIENYYFRSVIAVFQVSHLLGSVQVMNLAKSAHDSLSSRMGASD